MTLVLLESGVIDDREATQLSVRIHLFTPFLGSDKQTFLSGGLCGGKKLKASFVLALKRVVSPAKGRAFCVEIE